MSSTPPDPAPESAADAAAQAQGLVADPTGTTDIQERFRRDVRGRYETVLAELASALQGAPILREPVPDPARGRRLLRSDLEASLGEHVIDRSVSLRGVDQGRHWTAPHLRDAYDSALARCERVLLRAGYPEGVVTEATQREQTAHQRALRDVYYETFDDLERQVQDARTHAVREFGDRLDERAPLPGAGVAGDDSGARLPTAEIITAVRERVSARGQTPAETTAVTRTVETVNRAALTAYLLAGVDDLVVNIEAPPGTQAAHAEHEHEHRQRANAEAEVVFTTEDDQAVCPECQVFAGIVFSVEEMARGEAPRPPLHPMCRCFLVPMPTEEPSAAPLLTGGAALLALRRARDDDRSDETPP